MIKDLLKLADNLDKNGFHKEADNISKLTDSLSKSQVQKLMDSSSKTQVQKLMDTSSKVYEPVKAESTAARTVGQAKKLMDTSSKAYEAVKAESAAARAVGTAGRAAAAGTTEAAAGTAGAIGAGTALATTGAVISAALIGYEIGTVINEQVIERSGADKKVINWLLQPSLKNGIVYKVGIDASSIDPNLLKGAVSFVPYGVSGILMKGNQIVNKNSNAVFPNTNPVSLKQGAEVTLPQNQNGILIPTSVSVSIIYSNGTRRNAVSTPESTLFTAGSNVVIAKINTFGKSAR